MQENGLLNMSILLIYIYSSLIIIVSVLSVNWWGTTTHDTSTINIASIFDIGFI